MVDNVERIEEKDLGEVSLHFDWSLSQSVYCLNTVCTYSASVRQEVC